MPDLHILVSERVQEESAIRIGQIARAAGRAACIHTPERLAESGRLPGSLARIEQAFLSPDILGDSSKTQLAPQMEAFCALIDQAAALKWIQVPSAGLDRPQFQRWMQRGVVLCNASGVASVAVAQSAIAGMLALARKMPLWMEAQRHKSWEPLRGPREPATLEGKTVLVVGLGSIGQEVARLCRAFRMHVVGLSESGLDRANVCDEALAQSSINLVLPRCEWVVVCCPLTPSTQGLFNAERFGLLREGAGLVDVSRGGIVQGQPLEAALESGRVSCAYLDVFEEEPLLARSSLWLRPNVLVSPHYAGDFSGRQEKLADLFCRNLERSLNGLPLINAIAH